MRSIGVRGRQVLITWGNHQVSTLTPGTEVPEITVSLEKK
jgi:hypothetical protein